MIKTPLAHIIKRDAEYEKETVRRQRRSSMQVKLFIERTIKYLENKREVV